MNDYIITISYSGTASKNSANKIYNFLVGSEIESDLIFYDRISQNATGNLAKTDEQFLDIYRRSSIDIILYSQSYEESDNCMTEFDEIIKKHLKLYSENKRYAEKLIILSDDELDIIASNRRLKKLVYTGDYTLHSSEVDKQILKSCAHYFENNGFPRINVSHNPASRSQYQSLLDDAKKRINYNDGSKRTGHINLIMDRAFKYRLVIVNGPILSGKSTMVKTVVEGLESKLRIKGEYRIISHEESLERRNQKKISNIYELYQYWFKEICKELKKEDGSRIIPGEVDDYETFRNEFVSLFTGTTSSTMNMYFEYLKKHLGKILEDRRVVICVNLDNLNYYVKGEAFLELSDAINKFSHKESPKEIILIAITQYWPLKVPFEHSVIIGGYTTLELFEVFRPILDAEQIEDRDNFIQYIYDISQGHPWFVHRLEEKYLHYRSNGDDQPPLKMIFKILSENSLFSDINEYGIEEPLQFAKNMNRLFHKANQSEIDELTRYVKSFEYDDLQASRYDKNSLMKQIGIILPGYSKRYKNYLSILMRNQINQLLE
ncbi:MAG: hypothetical protein HQ556_13820 [Candidatus Marinimicrobia bacterium]|nr:hypothetical protein [Candidatus Neomarinimicrobiota bacterium]